MPRDRHFASEYVISPKDRTKEENLLFYVLREHIDKTVRYARRAQVLIPHLTIVNENLSGAVAYLTTVISPQALTPVTVAARLRTKQMKKGIAIAGLAGRYARCDYPLVEEGADFLHGSEQALVSLYPGQIICPTPSIHVKAVLFLL